MAVRLTISYPPRFPWMARTVDSATYESKSKAMRDLRDEFPSDAIDDATFCLALAADRDVLVKFEDI